MVRGLFHKNAVMLRYILILFILSGCANKQHRKAERSLANTERRQIDSLYLVKSIPVVVIDSLRNETSGFISVFSQQLTSNGFSEITTRDRIVLHTQYRDRIKLFSRDPKERQKAMVLASQNPNYLTDEMRRARPYAQTIKILPCYPAQPGCVQIKRNNHPYAVKTRKWVFNKTEEMTDESFISHILSVVAPSVK